MNSAPRCSRRQAARWILAMTPALGLAWLAGCSASLLPKPPALPNLFALDDAGPESAASTTSTAAPRSSSNAATLLVSAPSASAGFDTTQIVYLRRAHEIESFAVNRWVDTPAQMLAPMMVRALQASGAFRAVLRAPTLAAAELRLDTELIRLQQDFSSTPSRVRLTLRAVVVGGLSAIGAALTQIGVPKDQVIKYETALKVDKYVLMVHGGAEDAAKADAVLSNTKTSQAA